jgi:hypothetical protein
MSISGRQRRAPSHHFGVDVRNAVDGADRDEAVVSVNVANLAGYFLGADEFCYGLGSFGAAEPLSALVEASLLLLRRIDAVEPDTNASQFANDNWILGQTSRMGPKAAVDKCPR